MIGTTSQMYDSNDFNSNICFEFETEQTNDQPNFSGFGQKSGGDIREGFTIMPNILLVNNILDSNEKLVIWALRCFCWNDKRVCWPSRTTLSQMTGISERVLVDVFASLSGKKIISYQRTGYAGHNQYMFLDESIEAMIYRLESRSTMSDQRSTTQIREERLIDYEDSLVAQKAVTPMVAICAEIALMINELGYYLGKTGETPVSPLESISAKSALMMSELGHESRKTAETPVSPLESISAKSAPESYEFKNKDQEAWHACVHGRKSANLVYSGKSKENRKVQTSNNPINTPKSIYSLEICQQFTNEYAKSKLNTPDEIQDLARFALYCYRTGDKDVWIGAFVANGHQLAPYNPLAEAKRAKNLVNQVSQAVEEASNDPQPIEPKQVEPIKVKETIQSSQTSLPLEPKGKFSLPVYQDYVERVELPRAMNMGRTIHSTAHLAKYLQNTGEDDAKVAQFVERMNTLTLGGRGEITTSSTSVTHSVIDQVQLTTSVSKEVIEQVAQQTQQNQQTQPSQSFSDIGQSMLREIEAIQQLEAAQEAAFNQLSETEQSQLIAAKYEALMASPHRLTYKRMPKQALEAQIIQLVKKDLVSNC